jgi:GAF domain-containing protein
LGVKEQSPVAVQPLARTVAQVSGRLVGAFDLIEVLTLISEHCVHLCSASAAGVVLADSRGSLHVAAATNDAARGVEDHALRSRCGPTSDSYRLGRLVRCEDLAVTNERWEHFARLALDAGFRSVLALPVRLEHRAIGALELLYRNDREAGEIDVDVASAFAGIAALAVVLHSTCNREQIQQQLDLVLRDGRTIEEAKGMLAERTAQDLDWIDLLLKSYCRRTGTRPVDVAWRIIEGSLDFLEIDSVAGIE